jgi:hypothetical protein
MAGAVAISMLGRWMGCPLEFKVRKIHGPYHRLLIYSLTHYRYRLTRWLSYLQSSSMEASAALSTSTIPPFIHRVFAQAFDTFKAFDNLTVASSSAEQQAYPATIWQILQHLRSWQEHQLAQLAGATLVEPFDEKRSWTSERVPPSQAALQATVSQIKGQLAGLQTHAAHLTGEAPEVMKQVLVVQDAALHLSFHLGEVVLIRRLQGSYPWPAQMSEFLQA